MERIAMASLALAGLLAAGTAAAQDEDLGYPAGTLTPTIDLGLQAVPVEVPPAFRDQLPPGLTLNLPPGFSVRVFAAGLRGPRDLTVSPEGVLHAVLRSGQVISLPDRDADGVADEQIVVLDNLRVSDGIAFYKGDLYVGEEHQVVRAIDADGDGLYEDREVIVADLPWEAWHDTKAILFDERNEKLYVSVGSPCDLCRMEPGHQFDGDSTTETVPYSPERGSVLQFNADGTGRRIFVTGVRNVVGLALHPVTNEVWGTNNGHDLEGRSRPPEWIDVLRDGDFQGYPFVQGYHVWNDFSIPRYRPILPITRQDSLRAMSQKRPAALVPAHWAPMRIHFYTGRQFPPLYRNAAFIAFHAGKAKLSSHPGYNVQVLFSDPDGANARLADFITGFQTGTTTATVWAFPHGVTSDADGSLYVGSDSGHPVILKVTYSLLQGSWEPDLPASVVLGSAVDLRATVRIDRLAEGGDPPRVTADLRAFGGPADLELTPAGDGVYTLDVRVAAAAVGAHTLTVRLEQETGERTEVVRFGRTVEVVPPPWRHDLPDALVLGAAVDLMATVHLEPLAAAGPPPRATADLSALGGPAGVELIAAGDGDYILKASVRPDEAGEARLVRIRFAQEVGGVLYVHDYLHAVLVAPPDLQILDEVLTPGWRLDGDKGAQILGATAAGPVYSGRQSLAVRVQPENFYTPWSARLQPSSALEPSGFVGLRFAIHTGDLSAPRVAALALFIGDLSVDLLRPPYSVRTGEPGWQVIEAAFSDFAIENPYADQEDRRIREIGSIGLQGTLTGTLYLDDVRLVTHIPSAPPAATAVLQSPGEAVPKGFSLDPSYPNPFNAETTIRFRLPEAAAVHLTIYDLAGQRVVDLVAGRLERGVHRVTWDGRSPAGAAATGVYVVHLSAGRWTAAEKLLLLR